MISKKMKAVVLKEPTSAENVVLPESHVFSVQTNLSWTEMAAVPGTWGNIMQDIWKFYKTGSMTARK